MPLFDDVKDFFTIKDDSYYYDKLYPLQDEILALTFSKPTHFYLSGGTALNRFILPPNNKKLTRHSDDLDFFINLDNTKESLEYFHHAKEEIIKRIRVHYTVEAEKNLTLFSEYKILSDSSFIYYVYNDKIKLKLQFVLDYRKRSNTSLLLKDGYRLDNLNNILTNKVATLKYREEFKDFVDIYNIAKFNTNIEWNSVVEQTAKTSKVIGLNSKEFRNICRELLSLYGNSDINVLTKKVIFGNNKTYQEEQVYEILSEFEKLIIDKIK